LFDLAHIGFGRTGHAFAGAGHSGVHGDIVVLAKGLASGFPLAAVASRKQITDSLSPGMLGGTYAGNAVACAAAIATQHVIRNEGLVENSRRMGARYECIIE
jgi:4-aminobutyrate aminotransferase